MAKFVLPTMSMRLFTTALIAGAFATIGFDFLGQTISPLLKGLIPPYLGAKLAPVALATQSLSNVTGVEAKVLSSMGLGFAAHLFIGLLAYPFGYILLARPISNAVLPLPWWITGLAYGVVLYVFALYIMAHLVAGNPPFLGWSSTAWVALWGHLSFALIVAGIYHYRIERR